MAGATFEVGANVVIIVNLLIGLFTLIYSKRTNKEVKPNGGQSLKDAVIRTEHTVAAVAKVQGIEHITPPEGIPTTHKEGSQDGKPKEQA